MGFFLIRPCRSTAAFEAVPEQKLELELADLIPKLAELGYELIADAGVLLVVSKNGHEVPVYPSGKLLIKVDDENEAEKVAEELSTIIK